MRSQRFLAATTLAAALSLVALPSPAAQPSAGQRWLHVHVQESGDPPELVKVNIPFALFEKVAPVLQERALLKEKVKEARVRIGEQGLEVSDLRAMWEALKSAGEAEFVTVESNGESVRVSRSGAYLLVRSDKKGEKTEKVDVKLPLAVVDALFSGPDDTLNLEAAVRALAEQGGGDLVTVNDDKTVVRIWIDDRNGQ